MYPRRISSIVAAVALTLATGCPSTRMLQSDATPYSAIHNKRKLELGGYVTTKWTDSLGDVQKLHSIVVTIDGKKVIDELFEPFDGLKEFTGNFESMAVKARCTQKPRTTSNVQPDIGCEMFVDDEPAGSLRFDQHGQPTDA